MGAPVVFSHEDVDPNSIQAAQPPQVFAHEDVDPNSIQIDQPSVGSKILGELQTGAKAVDSVTGGPVRSAIYAAQNAKPGDRLGAAWDAGKKQFANMTDSPPSGEDIAKKAGVPTEGPTSPLGKQLYGGLLGAAAGPAGGLIPADKLSDNLPPSKVAGVGIDLAADPLNFAGPALKGVGKVAEFAKPVAEGLKGFANERALKAAGFMKKDFEMVDNKGLQDTLGSFLLDKKIVTPGATVAKVSERLETAKDAAGKTIGDIVSSAQSSNAPKISAKEIASELSKDPEIMNLGKVPGQEGSASQIQKHIETLASNDDMTLKEAIKLRQGIDKSINFNKRVPEMAGSQPYLYKMRDALSGKINDSVNAVTGAGEDIDRLKKANQEYSYLSTLEKVTDSRMGGLKSNRMFSLTDTMAFLSGLHFGHNPTTSVGLATGMAAANHTARAIGPGLLATGANRSSKILEGAPGLLSQTPTAAGPTINMAKEALLQKSKEQQGKQQ